MKVKRLFLPGMLFMLAGSFGLLAAGNFQEGFSQTYALEADGRVSLENINGNVRVYAWDRSEVQVEAVKTASTQDLLSDARIEVQSCPGAISIRTRYNDATNASPSSVDLTVRVPRTARLSQIKLVNGALEILGVTGGVTASSLNGTVTAHGISGDARLSTVNGKLEASFERLVGSESISMDTVNGTIDLFIPRNARAELHARNVTGGIDNGFGTRLHRVLSGRRTQIRLANINGRICIRPAHSGV